MFRILYLIAVSIPSITSIIECSTACKRCQDRDSSFEMLEIYCSMCLECRERRKEQLYLRRQGGEEETPKMYESLETPTQTHFPVTSECPTQQECPTQPTYQRQVECMRWPQCPIQLECPTQPECLMKVQETTTTTPKPTCPPVRQCQTRQSVMSCIPCLPICCSACPGVATTLPDKSNQNYAYFGVPRQVLKDLNIAK